MTINQAFSLRLQQYMRERNLNIYRFAKDSCIPRSTITNLLSGHSKSPTLMTLYQVADGLGVSVIEFLDCDLFRETNIEVK